MTALQRRRLASWLVLAGLSGCGPGNPPGTYAGDAAQQPGRAALGTLVGVRRAAAGGPAGLRARFDPMGAITAPDGSRAAGFAGSEPGRAPAAGFEYIVRGPGGDLVSVMQKDTVPLVLGQRVLVTGGNQARVLPDGAVATEMAPARPVDHTGAE